MKKTILSLITVMVLGTTVSYATSITQTQDDKTQKQEQTDMRHHDGDRKGGPRRPPMGPRIQATEGCKCATCEQIRKMEQEMEQRMKEHKDKKGCDCKKDNGSCENGSDCKKDGGTCNNKCGK